MNYISIKKISSFQNGYAFQSDDLKVEGINKVVKIKNIKQSIDLDDIQYTNLDDDKLKTFKIKKNDILIAMSGATIGKIAIAGEVENAYINQRVGIIRSEYSKFIYYNLLNPMFKEYVYLKSLSTAQPNISASDILNFNISEETVNNHKKIVDLLDVKCSEIDKIKKGIEITINDYKNIRKSIILETLLNGFNEKNDFKDSNITWIGRIPSHYKVVKIKHLCRLKGRIGWQGLKTNDYVDVGPYLITGTDFEKGYVNWKTCVHITESRYIEDENIHIYEDDLLITKDGTIGKLAIVKNSPEKVSLNSGVLLIRSNQKFEYDTKYLYYTLLSEIFWKWYNLNQTGNSTIKHLYQEQFYDFSFPLPPIEEQKEIVTYLDDKCNEIDNLINNKQEILKELELYKQSLIFEYVTGKKEV